MKTVDRLFAANHFWLNIIQNSAPCDQTWFAHFWFTGENIDIDVKVWADSRQELFSKIRRYKQNLKLGDWNSDSL